ncbi:zinc finger protein CONSTANS-LIKE 16-like [Neltuma alba]|uniref:zinc finger protein CONSTANS-LIKE 16-like n=1 Tax=Neltuma alba TaxID=207710 RepID=UPI0010A483BE|nr:zinc finger protein CONSTANS-LIKE 16-like [Prosopis alba]
MTSAKNAAHAVGGKTARACDNCIRKRARWYCAADDAFLCQSCDSLVHSANPLARRHERLRLKTASFKSSSASSDVVVLPTADLTLAPSWHRGITKKARTPRHGKNQSSAAHQTPRRRDEPIRNPFHLVPEVGSDEYSNSHDENEEQLLYRVPIFDPFVTELRTPPSSATSAEAATAATPGPNHQTADNNKETKQTESKVSSGNKSNNGVDNNLHGFLPSEMELAQFAADVESLLGRGLENECIGMEDLGLIDSKEKESRDCSVGCEKVKVEDEESPCKVETDEMEIGIREPFELNFDYDSPATREQADDEDDEKKVALNMANEMRNDGGEVKANSNQRKRKILLQLDYEAVISAWTSQKSPWTTGGKPDLDADECWPECMGACGMELHQPYYGEMGTYGCQAGMGDGGREARVSRYREKRRTRLFSKKIRYEVRKLNAEKRPRMKGRFVKRASFAVAAAAPQPSSCPFLSK